MSLTSHELENVEDGLNGSKVQFSMCESQAKRESWFKRRTTCEIAVSVMFVCSLVALIALIILSTQQNDAQATTEGLCGTGRVTASTLVDTDVCMTADCVTEAARMIDAMDQTVKPCDNFYEFACGMWKKKHIIPDDKSHFSSFSKLRVELEETLKELLEVPISKTDSEATTKAKTLYQSCINEEILESRDDKPLRAFVASLGGWPMIESDWNDTDFDVLKLVTDLRKYSNKIFFNSWVGYDDKNSSVNIIQFDQPGLGMPGRDYYLKGRDERKLMAYQNFAKDIAVALGADVEVAKKDANDIVDLEILLANITVPAEKRRDNEANYNRMTVAEMYTNITNKIDWLRYLNNLFSPLNMTIEDSEEVVVYSPVYMKKAADIIRNTPNRTLANYMVWRIVKNRVNNLNRRYRDLAHNYYKVLYGLASQKSSWRRCVSYANSNVAMAVGRMFVDKHFDERAKIDMLSMIKNIRKSFDNLLDTVTWLDDETRRKARQKAEAIREKIGYPEYIMNSTSLNAEFEHLHLNKDKYFENVLDILSGYYVTNFKRLSLPIDKTVFSTNPAIVNAYYSLFKNMIIFPAGILQSPFYKKTSLKALNYGGIGMLIGHEITHGFDDGGRQYNKDGNLVQWWSDKVVSDFKAKAQCIIDQYSNYTVKQINMKMNGINTQGENIADNGGIKQSFKAYRQWVADQGHEEKRLPGMQQFTPNQLFYLNFAQIWCEVARSEDILFQIRTGAHSPKEFRVIGALSNSEDFSEAFKCPLGSPMNPVKKCTLW